ncbi:MAG: S-formylglutathione hydrolase [Hyphomicrobiales bacterium]|nr:S-formylglutathione hydrolase [Hyphomicrobiales bacterium]MCP5370886.1 S-formylglutathione hydrolase [Hyphomicrobiales bacterium]
MTVTRTAEHRCFGGTLTYAEHAAEATGTTMRFTVFTPPAAAAGPVPVLTWLSGLTCTAENFTTKAGAYGPAAEMGVMVVAPDTSPRGDGVPDDDAYDLGQGAGFYVDATQAPWAGPFTMETYVTRDLQRAVFAEFPGDPARQGVFGHSMGGHGALTLWQKRPDLFTSASAFAPIVAPAQVPWGRKAFAAYLGDDPAVWNRHDACALMAAAAGGPARPAILVDQGLGDGFLDEQLRPELFEAACAAAGQALSLRRHDGYDHSYFFMATFMADHIRHHAAILAG